MRIAIRLALGLAALAALGACTPAAEPPFVRGTGLKVADLPVRDQVAIYQEAVGGAFTVGDPSLYLLLNPRFLPRTAGFSGGEPLSPTLRNAILMSGLAQGTCEPLVTDPPKVAHCRAQLAGYVVRFSQVLRLPADTMEVYLYVQRYSTPTSVGIDQLDFERLYKVVKHATGWDAVMEGRIEHP
ncbi:MAG: hypothetical protein KGL38_08655 [Gemmatimonadota bacterium]|nr:hypothetical protein [Gemmatimonadota bacterium]MDE3128064.1 hypothetical protein [Gemmatimonadota bacterium]MDE3172757.1 hypothetical protein [Gemmatimonadota bacterium]